MPSIGTLDCEIIRGPAAAGAGLKVYDSAAAERLFGNADVILASPDMQMDRTVMQAAPRLRAIISPAIGVENIDIDAATELGIIVGHGATPENFLGMAEATVMLIAALAMQLPGKQRLLAENAPRPRELTAHSVRGRNRRDLEDIPAEAREKLEFVWLEQVDDALKVALSPGAGQKT